MRLSILFKALLLLALYSTLSCNKNETIVSDGTGINVPSYVSVQNTFSYIITAQQLTDMQTVPLSFTRTRLQIAAAISNSTQGRVIFSLLGETSTTIHTDTFRLTGMYRVFTAVDLPVLVSITFQDFTGSIHYVLVGDTLVSEYFPNGRGSQWTYFVHDSL